MRILLELLRIIIIFVFLGGIGYLVIESIYTINDHAGAYAWIGAVAIYVLLFIVYRNKWQFTGFYKGKEVKKLSRKTTMFLTCVSIILIVSPLVIGVIVGGS